MPRTVSGKRKKAKNADPLVNFRYQNTEYQIDPEQRKVYRNWVSVESAKTFTIMNAWATSAR